MLVSRKLHSDDITVAIHGWSIPTNVFRQIFKQLEQIQEVVLAEVSQLNDLAITKQEIRNKTNIEKDLSLEKIL